MKFRQAFEITENCKKAKTMFNRFAKKYPEAWNVWGEEFEYMLANGIEHEEEEGWSLWLYTEEDTHYMAIVLTDERQKI